MLPVVGTSVHLCFELSHDSGVAGATESAVGVGDGTYHTSVQFSPFIEI